MSNPLQALVSDDAELARRLADSDDAAPGPVDSTLAELRQQLETLTEQLRRPAPADEFADESACRRVVEAIGRDPSRSDVRAERTPVADADAIPAELAQLGQYRLLTKLGQGGMGAVYKALHVRLDKVVAVKVLPQEVTQRADAVARFEREMRAVGKLQHPNIVAAHDAGEANGNHFLVMELVDGEDVGSLVRRRGALPMAESCEIVRQAALGLQHAHEHGLVHRDVKPSNLMVAEGQGSRAKGPGRNATENTIPSALGSGPLAQVKILDMGLALLDESHRETAGELTSTGQIMGTLDYMAPEQGADTHTVDIRADVYSLGATLYKLLCGHAPFEGPRYSTQIKKLTALATAEPERIEGLRPEVPQELADLVHRMLSKTPAARPTPPTEVARLIAPFADGADLNRLFDPADAVDSSVSPTAETATDPTFIAETNVAQPATWDGPPGPSTSGAATAPFPPTASEKQTLPTPSPLSRANDAKSRTNTIAGEGPGVREQTQASPPPSSILNSQSTLSRPPRRPLGRYAAFAAPLLIGLAVIIINTKQGTVTVKTSDTLPDAVTIAVRQGGEDVQILDKDNNWTVHVRAGEYELEVRGGNDEFKLEEDEHGVSRLGVSRWGTTLVEVTHDPRSTEPTPMPANFALQFDGVDDYVAIPTLSMPEKGPWTIECRFSANDKYGDLFSYVGGLRLWIVPARSEVHWRARKSSGEFCEGRWPIRLQSIHTVALSYDEARLQLFVDGKWIGELDAPDVELARLPQNPPLKAIATLGSLPHPDTHLAGTIEQFRLSNTSRYTGDYTLHARFTPDEHTVCLYHFDEGDGDVLTDASGNGHHGKIVGATWVPADAPPSSTPTTNFALQFDGVDDYVDIPSLRLGTDSPWTIEGRYRTADVFGDIVSYSGGVRVWLSSRLNWDVGGEGKAFQAKPDWNANQVFQSHEDWTSFAVVYDGNGTTAHFFINGRKVVDLTADRIAVEDEAADQYARLRLVLGGLAAPYWEKLNPDSYFSGEIDELRISSSARYADDYSLTDRFEPDEQTVALYHFDEREGDVLTDASGNGHHGKIVGAKWVPVIPNSDYAADRRVATWVLDQGGRVRIEAGAAAPGETSDYLVAADELPQEPFRLVEVQLDHNRNLRHEQLEQLTTLMHLRIVRLEYSRLPDDSLRVLANCPSLEMLYAPNNQLTDAGMLHLRDMPKLWLLHLSSNHITDAGLAHLASLTNLRQLYLARTDINDVAIPHLSRLSNLKQLDLAGTAVTPAAVATLQPALPECEILTRSYESRGFALQFDGQTTFATLPVIYDGSTPLTVEMWMTYEPGKAHDWTPFLIGNRWGEDGLVLRADRNRPAVELRGSGQAVSAEPFPSGRMFHVAGVFTADELRLYVDGILAARQPVTEDRRATSKPFVLGAVTWEALESENAEELTGLLQGSVDAVRLSSTERYTTDFFPDTRFIPDEHTLALYHFDEGQGDVLTDASGNGHHGKIVGATWVPGPSVPYDVDRRIATELLSNGPGPHVAVLIGDQRRTIGSVEELPAEPFRVVAVEFDGKSPDDLQPLGELRFVEWINLQGCAVTDEDLKPLQGCVSLQDLGVKLTQVTGPGFGYLVGLPNLRSLDLGGSSATDVALLHIGELTGIESLEMIYSEVTDAGLSQLGNLKRLSRLSIFGSHVTGAGLSHLSKDRLTVLGVAQSAVSDADVETLKKFQALVHLNLTGTRMTADGAQRLARALPNCKIVTDFGVFDPGVSTPADFALQFDGVDDYVEIPLPGVTLGPEFTVELQADTLTVPTIAEGPAEVTWLLDWPRDEALSLEWWAWSAEKTDFSASVNKAGALSFSKWQEPAPGPHHFAVVYRDGATQLYVDGRALDYNGQSQVDPAGLASQVLAIGARLPVEEMQNAQFHFFQGLVDELRISTVARYTEDFEPAVRHEVDAHTLALYHFDEGEGEILHDASGNGHHGKIVGATWVPALATADGRDIAEWVLAIGGKVTVQLVGEEQPRLIATAEALPQEAWRLVGVDLSYTKVTDDDLARLRGAAALQTLNLDSAELIGDAGLLNLAGLPLTSLDLRNTQVTDGSVPVLQQLPQLSLLSLAHTGVTDAGMAGLAKLSRLEQLNVCNNPITDAGLAELRGLSSLKSLASYDTAITDAGLAHVAEMTALEYLHVGDTQVSDAGLIHLSSLKQLRQLNLDRTAVSDAGLVHLAALPSIAALWLEETQITDAGLQHLKPLSTLGDLSVKRTAVTEAGLQQLHADLPACRIDSDFGTVEPANDRAVAEWVLSRQGLVGLREGDADVQVREVSELPAACRVLKVSLGDVSDSDLINLKGLEGLRELTLRNCPQLTDAGLVHLRELPNLRWLILGGTAPDLKSQVSDRGMALFLEGFPRLEFVSLQYEAITDEGLRHLCSKPGLGMLDLYGTSISDEGLQHLPQLAGLSIVTLPEQIGDAGLAHLKGMKSLTTVYLPGCDRITIEGLRTLASLPSLFELQLTNTQLNDEDVLVLAGSTTLKKLHLRGTEVTQDGIDRLRQALPACWIDSDFGTFEPAADAESTGATP